MHLAAVRRWNSDAGPIATGNATFLQFGSSIALGYDWNDFGLYPSIIIFAEKNLYVLPSSASSVPVPFRVS